MAQPKKNLTPEQIKALQAQGMSPGEVSAYINGAASPNVTARANVILANGGVFKAPTGQTAGTQSRLPPLSTVLGPAISGIWGSNIGVDNAVNAAGKAVGNAVGIKPNLNGLGNPYPQNPFPNGLSGGGASDTKRIAQTNAVKTQRTGLQQNTAQAVKPVDPMAGYPQYPGSSGSSVVPTITPQDFTEQARTLADNAFAPVQSMLDQSKENVGVQGERSRKIVGGLYDKMVNDIATEAARQSATYDQSKATAATQGAELSNQIGQNYSSGNQQTADLLQKIGAQQAAPEVLQQGANDQAFAQSQADRGTNAIENYYGQQQQGQSDYNGQLGNIQRNEGVNAQGNILNQVRNMLAGIDQQKADTSAQSAQLGLTMADKMTANDLQAQQANAGFAQQGNQAANQQYQAQVDQFNTRNQLAQQDYSNQASAAQQQFDNNISLGNLANSQAVAQAKVGGASAPQGNGLDASRARYAAQDPKQGAAIFDAALAQLQTVDPSDSAKLGKYLQSVRDYANAHGMNPDQAALIAVDIFHQAYGNG